ncbi:MAG: class I SAM-dependent methyltransferase [Pseudonocardiaceae bacterium]
MEDRIRLVPTRWGFLEVSPKPSPSEVAEYYHNKYYSSDRVSSVYAATYTAEELKHKRLFVDELLHHASAFAGRAYEVGYGEGFVLRGLSERGWEISGIDFTADALKTHNPELLPRLSVGNVLEHLEDLCRSGERYEVVVCSNVLEHVLDPEALARSLVRLTSPTGVCCFVVPNDGSIIQAEAVKRGMAEEQFWMCYPDHLSYFTLDTLENLLTDCGWAVTAALATFPIDAFLLNPDTNYRRNRSLGRNCYHAAIAFELALAERSIDSLIAFRRGCASAGVGRDLIVYCSPEPV